MSLCKSVGEKIQYKKKEHKFDIPIINPPKKKKCFPATLKLKHTEEGNKSNKCSNRTNSTEDFPREKDEEVSDEMKLTLAQQLDSLMSAKYDFVEVAENIETEPSLEVNEVNHTISFYFLSEEGSQIVNKPKPKFQCDKVSYEDLRNVAVTGEWVLNKSGVYGKGRERIGELVTGAEHSPRMKKRKK